jgi:hypothetical protein
VIRLNQIKRWLVIAAFVLIPLLVILLLNIVIEHRQGQPVVQDTAGLNNYRCRQMKCGRCERGTGLFSRIPHRTGASPGKTDGIAAQHCRQPQPEQKVRDNAALKLVQLADNLAREMQTETLLKAKGCQECAVILEGQRLTIILDQKVVGMKRGTNYWR